MSTGLRICVASSGLGHVSRGVEAWAADLAESLAGRAEDVLLCKGSGAAEATYETVVPCWKRTSASACRVARWLPSSVAWRVGLASGYGVEQTTFAVRLIRVLRKEQVDILHLQDPQVASLVQRASRLGLVKTRTVLMHGTEEPPEFQQKITYLQHGAPWHREQAEQRGIWKDSWTMIPNFVDTKQFRPGDSPDLRTEFAIPADADVVMVSSAIKRRHKRVDFLIREMSLLRQQQPDLPVWFLIAGARGPDTDELIREAREALGDRVRFAVEFPSSRMPELYRTADLLIHGSFKEMMPIALLEAMASGLPCLVHEHPVMQWMVGRGGVPLDLRTEGVLASAVGELLENPSRRQMLGQLARARCEQLFSRELVVDQILRYYQRISEHGPRQRDMAA